MRRKAVTLVSAIALTAAASGLVACSDCKPAQPSKPGMMQNKCGAMTHKCAAKCGAMMHKCKAKCSASGQ